MRKILVTSALNYANGDLHLGHILEVIQTDIWARFQRLIGNECYYVAGTDAHGTPIMIKAENEGMTPEALVQHFHDRHWKDFQDFLISCDSFYTTHSKENQVLCETIYQTLLSNGDIEKRTVTQAYDPVKNMFLPDRYVKGTCPRCDTADQYGDSCEHCGATYSPTDLKNPISVISGATPIEKSSEHLFFQLSHYEKALKAWYAQDCLQTEIVRKMDEWFTEGLRPWNISRDKPYFGFQIPGIPDKYFYVWLDAPIGYMAGFQKLCETKDLSFDDFWRHAKETELYHFVGKDIIYFHALFWPAMLMAAKFRLPSAVFAHGFLTINGKKMSKSRGTFITARQYLDRCNPEYLRYYFAAKLTSSVEDIDLNFEDLRQRVNADLVGKLVNIASRSAGFIHKQFNGKLSGSIHHPALLEKFVSAKNTIATNYENRQYAKVIREVMELADSANQYIDEQKPWTLAKQEETKAKAHEVCSMGLHLFRILMTYLKPVLPNIAEQSESFLNTEFTWQSLDTPLLNHAINPFVPLAQRMDEISFA